MRGYMKILITILVLFSAQYGLAGGNVGTGPGKEMFGGRTSDFALKTQKEFLDEKAAGQVYYLRKNQAEIQFATNKPGDDKVELQSLRPEEISDSALIDGLKRSQQSKQWENIKLPSKLEMNRIILNNKLGGMQVR
jgi:hypothetical protein